MDQIVYRGVVLPASQSEDGESPTAYVVTKEVNGYALFIESFQHARKLIDFESNANRLIEKAVYLTWKERRVEGDQLFKFNALVAGGRGPHVWDSEKIFEAPSILAALLAAMEDLPGDSAVVSIEQKD